MVKYLVGNVKGKDGVSPEAKVEQSGNTATITITDASGTTTATITGGGGGGAIYTAGEGIEINDYEISVDNTIATKEEIPTAVSQLDNDAGFITSDSPAGSITAEDIQEWNNKSDFSGDYADLANKPDLTQYATKTELNGKQDTLTAGANITIENNVISATGGGSGTTYTAGEGINISGIEISVDKQVVALKSEIPTAVSELTNDADFASLADVSEAGYVTEGDLSVVAVSGNYEDLVDKPTIPVVPTNVSAFTNDAGYITSYTETDPVFTASPAAGITASNISSWNNKQDALTAGTGISIENNVISATGSGGTEYTAGNGIEIENDEISIDDTIVALKSDIPAEELPSIASGDAGKVLKVNSTETGVEWATESGGGSPTTRVITYQSDISDYSAEDKEYIENAYENGFEGYPFKILYKSGNDVIWFEPKAIYTYNGTMACLGYSTGGGNPYYLHGKLLVLKFTNGSLNSQLYNSSYAETANSIVSINSYDNPSGYSESTINSELRYIKDNYATKSDLNIPVYEISSVTSASNWPSATIQWLKAVRDEGYENHQGIIKYINGTRTYYYMYAGNSYSNTYAAHPKLTFINYNDFHYLGSGEYSYNNENFKGPWVLEIVMFDSSALGVTAVSHSNFNIIPDRSVITNSITSPSGLSQSLDLELSYIKDNYATKAEIPSYTAGDGIDIDSNNVITTTDKPVRVIEVNNITSASAYSADDVLYIINAIDNGFENYPFVINETVYGNTIRYECIGRSATQIRLANIIDGYKRVNIGYDSNNQLAFSSLLFNATAIQTGLSSANAPSGNVYSKIGDELTYIKNNYSYPSFTNNAGKVLAVNSNADGVEWITAGGGGTSYQAGSGINIDTSTTPPTINVEGADASNPISEFFTNKLSLADLSEMSGPDKQLFQDSSYSINLRWGDRDSAGEEYGVITTGNIDYSSIVEDGNDSFIKVGFTLQDYPANELYMADTATGATYKLEITNGELVLTNMSE